MADQTSFRGYHQSGILLPDGRVISFAGQFGNDPNRFVGNFQLYSPPYLFKGRRPTITRLPANAPSGGTVFLQTPEAGLISRVTMLRPRRDNSCLRHGSTDRSAALYPCGRRPARCHALRSEPRAPRRLHGVHP